MESAAKITPHKYPTSKRQTAYKQSFHIGVDKNHRG